LAKEKLWTLRAITASVLRAGVVSGLDLAALVGQWTWACLARRPSLSCSRPPTNSSGPLVLAGSSFGPLLSGSFPLFQISHPFCSPPFPLRSLIGCSHRMLRNGVRGLWLPVPFPPFFFRIPPAPIRLLRALYRYLPLASGILSFRLHGATPNTSLRWRRARLRLRCGGVRPDPWSSVRAFLCCAIRRLCAARWRKAAVRPLFFWLRCARSPHFCSPPARH
jgi:hypothetical protein